MRRLQKVVHKREPNVNQEKQDFESAKRDLELTLKTIMASLQIKESGRTSVSDVSEIPHKHDKQVKLKPKSDAQPLNLKIQNSSAYDNGLEELNQKTPSNSHRLPTEKMPEDKSRTLETSNSKPRSGPESAHR